MAFNEQENNICKSVFKNGDNTTSTLALTRAIAFLINQLEGQKEQKLK